MLAEYILSYVSRGISTGMPDKKREDCSLFSISWLGTVYLVKNLTPLLD